MERSLFIFSSKLSKALVTFLVLVIGFEICAWGLVQNHWAKVYLHSTPYPDDALRFRALVEMKYDDKSPRIVFMGSSQPREDVDVLALKTHLSDNNYSNSEILNLGVSGGWTIATYLQLAPVLQTNPDVIVLMPYWRSYYQSFDVAKTKLYLFSLDDLIYLAEQYGWHAFFNMYKEHLLGCLITLTLPTYRYHKSLFNIAKSIVLDSKRNEVEYFAHVANKPSDYFEKEINNDQRTRLTISKETEIQKSVFLDFVERIRSNGIKLIVIDPPWHPRTAELQENQKETWLDYKGFMTSTSKQFGFVYVNLDALPSFTSDEFVSFAYLNEKGRKRFTPLLAKILLRSLS